MAQDNNKASAAKAADAKQDNNAEVATLKETIVAKDAKIADLEKQLAAAKNEAPATTKPKTKTHQFLVDEFRFKGTKYSAEDAVKDTTLMKALVEANFSGLKKL